jgi:hypothetical protein
MSDSDQNDAVRIGHEPIGLSATAVAKGFSVLYAVMVVSLLLMAGLILLFSTIADGEATVEAPAPPPLEQPGVTALDSNQKDSLRALRARETKALTEYRWLDAEAGVARIPIKRAMEILGQSGNLSTQAPSSDLTNP